MKNLLTILTIFLFLWVGEVIAQEDEGYETDGTLCVETDDDDGRSLNGIYPYRHSDSACFWIVGDSGLVLRYRGYERDIAQYPNLCAFESTYARVLNPAHNLMSVSFAPNDDRKGWIVGYVNGGTDKWRGVIYKTIDGGVNWTYRYPDIAPGEKIPCLKVQAINENYVWVTCGNDYVLRTIDGGVNWRISRKKY